jgi:glycosyltransferase involved in cell wall biosynthesis
MQPFPSVSILIATFDQSAMIEKAVQTALLQDYPNLTIIIADDGPGDETEKLLQPYLQNSAIRYKKNLATIGRMANYHQLLYELADTDWVIYLDGDDHYTDPHFISEAMQSIQKTGIEKVLFYQGAHLIKNNSGEKMMQTNIPGNEVVMSAGDYFISYFKLGHFSHLATLYNRKLAMQTGFYTTDILSADVYSVLQACISNKEMMVILSGNIAGVWFWHDNNAGKKASLSAQQKNMSSLIGLHKVAAGAGFKRSDCNAWKWTAIKTYSRSFIGAMIKKLPGF